MNLRKNLDTTVRWLTYILSFTNKYRVNASLYQYKTIRPSDFTAAGLFL